MRQLSSSLTFLYKRVIPVSWFGFIGLAAVKFISGANFEGSRDYFIVIAFLVMIGMGYLLMKVFVLGLMDVVLENQDSLIIRNRGAEEVIPRLNIINVSSDCLMNPSRVTLFLREPCRFGREILFCPESDFEFLMINTVEKGRTFWISPAFNLSNQGKAD